MQTSAITGKKEKTMRKMKAMRNRDTTVKCNYKSVTKKDLRRMTKLQKTGREIKTDE